MWFSLVRGNWRKYSTLDYISDQSSGLNLRHSCIINVSFCSSWWSYAVSLVMESKWSNKAAKLCFSKKNQCRLWWEYSHKSQVCKKIKNPYTECYIPKWNITPSLEVSPAWMSLAYGVIVHQIVSDCAMRLSDTSKLREQKHSCLHWKHGCTHHVKKTREKLSGKKEKKKRQGKQPDTNHAQ